MVPFLGGKRGEAREPQPCRVCGKKTTQLGWYSRPLVSKVAKVGNLHAEFLCEYCLGWANLCGVDALRTGA